MAEIYTYLFNENLVPKPEMTEGEAEYLATRGKSVRKLLAENGRDIAPDGTVGMLTVDGRVVSGADYCGGFCFGDIVRLKSGGSRMTVIGDARLYPRGVLCDYFVNGERKQEKFLSDALEYLGCAEDLPPESKPTSFQEYRAAMAGRGEVARRLKDKKVRIRRAA